MEIRFQFHADLNIGPATKNFVQRHKTLFDLEVGDVEVGEDFCDMPVLLTLRKGAPVIQMLEATPDFVQGSAEPWIVDVLCALLTASDQRTVLECGAFIGQTSLRLCQTLAQMGGGNFTAVEIDPERAAIAQERLENANLPPTVHWRIVQQDVFEFLKTVPDGTFSYVWVDDDHEHMHVDAELNALFPKCAASAIIAGHDVHGSCDLQQEFKRYGGIALDLPRIGPAGGIGLLQL